MRTHGRMENIQEKKVTDFPWHRNFRKVDDETSTSQNVLVSEFLKKVGVNVFRVYFGNGTLCSDADPCRGTPCRNKQPELHRANFSDDEIIGWLEGGSVKPHYVGMVQTAERGHLLDPSFCKRILIEDTCTNTTNVRQPAQKR